MIILDNLRRHEGIEVTDEDVEAKLAELAAKRDVSVDDFRRAVAANDNMDRLRHDLEEEKIFAFLEEKAEISVVKSAPAASKTTRPC